MSRKLWLFLWVTFIGCSLIAQASKPIVHKLSEPDSIYLRGLKIKISGYINPKPDSAAFVLQEYRAFVEDRNFGRGEADVDYLYASYFRRMQNSDSAIFYFNQSVEKAKRIGYGRGQAVSYNGLCHVYSKLGEMELALSAGESCVSIARESGERDTEAAGYLAIGQIHMRQNELAKALLYHLKIDSLNQDSSIKTVIVAGAYQNIGDIYLGLMEYDKAESYFLKSIKEYKSLPQDVSFYLRHTDWYLGQLYFAKEEYEKAKTYLEVSHGYFEKIRDNHTLAEISKTLGLVYINTNQKVKGGQLLQQAYNLQNEFGNRNEMAYIGIALGQQYIDQGETEQAIGILKSTLKDVKTLNNSKLVQEANIKLGDAYSKQGDHELAYLHQKIGYAIKDSLQLIQSASQIRELEEVYQTEQKEKEITFLKSENALADEQRKNQRNILVGGIVLTSLASLLFFFLYRNRQQTNKKLKEIDQAKSTFFTNISHEFRTPLTLIKGPIQEQLKDDSLSLETRRKFEMVDRNSDRLLQLVDQTLDVSKIESGGLFLKVARGNAIAFIATLGDAYNFIASEKNVGYSKEIVSSSHEDWYDQDALEKITTNLLGNAFKYTPSGSKIKLKAKVDNGKLNVEVKNQGPGISKDNLNKIFDRFYQVNKGSDGVGVGLAYVQDLLNLHKGKISAKSKKDDWTTFTVEIPVVKSAFLSSELALERNVAKVDSNSVIGDVDIEQSNGASKPILLIVEDNKDVRQFVKEIFIKDYEILEAEDGQKGIEVAIKNIPDVILSDVMMPIVDGVELCQTLKNHSCTSHIPMILLTAKAGDENELTGLKSGADDYVTKPFNVDLIKTKIDNLLEIRKVLREKYSNELFIQPKDLSATTADEKLLIRIKEILEEKISDGKFNVEAFSSMLGMSRMQLHRKLKSLTGLSASEFIRSQRIIMAAHLLKETDKNVSEVVYSVGFNDHAYFSKCFKQVYHCSPSEFAMR